MTMQTKNFYETQTYPCLIFFLQSNPTFGKTFSLCDVVKPSLETYNRILGDYATRGRTAPSYDEWASNCQLAELKSLVAGSKCPLMLVKFAVTSFEDIAKIKEVDGFVRYNDARLNEYFCV